MGHTLAALTIEWRETTDAADSSKGQTGEGVAQGPGGDAGEET